MSHIVTIPGIEEKPARKLSLPGRTDDGLTLLGLSLSLNPSDLAAMSEHARVEMSDIAVDMLASEASLLVQTAHKTFSDHRPLALSPEVLWYAIMHEVATYIKANPETHAEFFGGNTDQKKLIEIRDDDPTASNWQRPISMLYDKLSKALPDQTIELFIPPFSTLTDESRTALMIAMFDTASPYFEFAVSSLCGIPRIKLVGEVRDWELLLQHTNSFAEIFTGLKDYFAGLQPVLKTILETVQGVDHTEFWKSIYKTKSHSGEDTYFSGWLTSLFAYVYAETRPQLKTNFDWKQRSQLDYHQWDTPAMIPSHISVVDFKWKCSGRDIPMGFVGGILGVTHDEDGFSTPQLGYAVIKKSE